MVETVIDFAWPRALVLTHPDDGSYIPLPSFEIKASVGWAITEISTYFIGFAYSPGQAGIVPQQNTQISWFGPEPSSVKLNQSIFPMSNSSSSYWYLSDDVKLGKSCSEADVCTGVSRVTVDMSKSFKASIPSPESSLAFSFAEPYSSGFTKQWIMVKTERVASAVPEPGALLLFAMGVVGLGVVRRRSASSSSHG